MKKNTKTTLWSSVSVLIVVTLCITAFIRGNWQFWLLLASFAVWAIWAGHRYLIPYLRNKSAQKEATLVKDHCESQAAPPSLDVDITDSVPTVLLRHVNHRISGYLHSVYPDATWEWCSQDPELLVAQGGIGRIRLDGVADYNYAEVTLDQNASIGYKLLRIVPLTGKEAPQTMTVNPQIWYEKKGKQILRNLIADFDSRGYKSLTILEDGSITIQQAGKYLKRKAFPSVPERAEWPDLVKVLEREGVASAVTESGLVLSW